jgi:putative flippase GtrA
MADDQNGPNDHKQSRKRLLNLIMSATLGVATGVICWAVTGSLGWASVLGAIVGLALAFFVPNLLSKRGGRP